MPIDLHDPRTGTTARIVPEIGFNCCRFQVRAAGEVIDVIDCLEGFETGESKPTRSGVPLLFPFPNRIANGRFSWDGSLFQLPLNHGDHAIHGFVLDRPWRVTHVDETSVTGEFQLSRDAPDRRALWPADFLIQVRYQLHEQSLLSKITIRNPDRVPLPWGCGTHTYFKVPVSPRSQAGQCLLQIPASEVWELEGNIPTGVRRPASGPTDYREGQALAGATFDHLLTGVQPKNGRVETVLMDPRAGLQVTQLCDPQFREFVAFTPPHGRSVCMEPYTCATDAINLQPRGIDAGLHVLPPGGEANLWLAIAVSPVMV